MSNSDSVLSMYLKEINRIPLLSYEEESELAVKAAQGDKTEKDATILPIGDISTGRII